MGIPQRPFFNNQDIVSPDIDLYYKTIIQEIDRFRSRFNGITSNLSQTISQKNLDAVFSANESNSIIPQESRCNAFYRMIGFPVVSADGTSFYSPGHDPSLNRDDTRRSKNMEIANSILKKLQLILNDRETYSRNGSNFFRNKDINATALGISSIYVRPFDKQLKPGVEPLDIDTQVFSVPDRNYVSADFSETVVFSTQSKHILKPFIVDPRIELTVTPALNRICAPFLDDKSQTQITKGNHLKRPYIERVIRVRFNDSNVIVPDQSNEAINAFINGLVDFIKDSPEITDQSLVDLSSNSLKGLHKSEIVVFSKFIKIINAMVYELAKSRIQIDKIRKNINWKPIIDKSGPEFGATLNSVKPTDTINNKNIETDIINLEIKQFLDQTNFDIGVNDPDLGGFSFSNVDDMIFDGLKKDTQFYTRQLDTLNRRREETGSQANKLLRNIEIITGEFSGLGLLDIIAIQATLWIIDKNSLLGLIDDSAIERMQNIQGLRANTGGRATPLNALKEFEKKLSEIYVLMELFYQNSFNADFKNKQ